MKDKVWLSSPHLGTEELEFVKEAFETNWIAPLGPHVNGFEADLASYCGVKNAAALSSGTAAIHLALIMLGVDIGDEVICSSFTFSGSANPIMYQKATPVFVDSEYETWNMNPEFLEEAIKDRIANGKKPKAIILVHLYGMPAKVDEIKAIANKYEIPIVEDAAEALGSKYKGKAAGSFGVLNVLSFNGNKIITTSGGGALLSDNDDYIKRARFLSTQAREDAAHYQHTVVGYNYRMSNVLAGIGRGQMKVLDERVKTRREIFNWYKNLFGETNDIILQPEAEGSYSNRWLTAGYLNPEKYSFEDRERFRLLFAEENIEVRPLWKSMHLQPVFEGSPFYGDGSSEKMFELGLCFPSGTNMVEEHFERIEATYKLFLNK